MTVKECYAALCGNYDDAKNRLMTDRLIEKFMLKFPQDGTMKQLQESLEAGDYEVAFRCAHTLKGVAANLAFTALQTSASQLTELLRADKSAPDEAVVQKVVDDYNHTLEVLTDYQNGQS